MKSIQLMLIAAVLGLPGCGGWEAADWSEGRVQVQGDKIATELYDEATRSPTPDSIYGVWELVKQNGKPHTENFQRIKIRPHSLTWHVAGKGLLGMPSPHGQSEGIEEINAKQIVMSESLIQKLDREDNEDSPFWTYANNIIRPKIIPYKIERLKLTIVLHEPVLYASIDEILQGDPRDFTVEEYRKVSDLKPEEMGQD